MDVFVIWEKKRTPICQVIKCFIYQVQSMMAAKNTTKFGMSCASSNLDCPYVI